MNHSFLEPGMFRHFREGWHFELSWGGTFRWAGVKYQQSRDGERGRTLSLGAWWVQVYIVRERSSQIERNLGIWLDEQYLNVANYRGDDEMNSHPWMWEWPWKRWHHVRHDWIGPKRRFPYRYERSNGGVQEVTATVRMEEREWRWIDPHNPFRIRVRRYLDVRFSDEVGERTGTWKGGVLGCAIEMERGEDEVGALRRMERERRFT